MPEQIPWLLAALLLAALVGNFEFEAVVSRQWCLAQGGAGTSSQDCWAISSASINLWLVGRWLVWFVLKLPVCHGQSGDTRDDQLDLMED